ncbi:hypothetical protein [Streptomyces sp. NPDC059943]|uniref:hypothetical protein n=1 Tax=Streptomyces sp. NPDC059943 TaxID=3347010 RepID=UPI0036689378
MPLHTKQFFDDVLQLPFEGTVVGDAYFATFRDSPLKLRIDFAPTITAGEYGGLRLMVIHPGWGSMDTTILSFADHATFTDRDARLDIPPGRGDYGTFRDWHAHRREPPWKGADGTELRQAVEKYATVWFPGSTGHPSAPSRAAGPAAHTLPVPPRAGGRTH